MCRNDLHITPLTLFPRSHRTPIHIVKKVNCRYNRTEMLKWSKPIYKCRWGFQISHQSRRTFSQRQRETSPTLCRVPWGSWHKMGECHKVRSLCLSGKLGACLLGIGWLSLIVACLMVLSRWARRRTSSLTDRMGQNKANIVKSQGWRGTPCSLNKTFSNTKFQVSMTTSLICIESMTPRVELITALQIERHSPVSKILKLKLSVKIAQ